MTLDDVARQEVIARLEARIIAIDELRRLCERRGDARRLEELDGKAKLLQKVLGFERDDPPPSSIQRP
jgi:hypothetical protein